MSYGMDGHVAIGFQNSFGTANVDSFHYFPIITESLAEKVTPLVSEGMRGRFEAGDDYDGPREVGGDVVFPAHPVLIGKALKAWCGQASGTLATSAYTHTFKPRTVDFDGYAAVPPMTVEVYRGAGSAHQYYDMLCDALVIEVAYGQIVKATMTLMGGKFGKVEKTAPSYLPGSEYTWDQSSVSFQGSADGAIDDLSAFTITMKNNLTAKGTLDGSRYPNRIKRNDFRMIELAGTMIFVNDQEFDHYRNMAAQRVVFTITGQNVSSGVPAKFEIDIPHFRYSAFPVNIGGPAMIEAGFAGEAKYHSDSGTMIQFTLVNTLVAY